VKAQEAKQEEAQVAAPKKLEALSSVDSTSASGHDDAVFEIIDYTLASPWEKCVAPHTPQPVPAMLPLSLRHSRSSSGLHSFLSGSSLRSNRCSDSGTWMVRATSPRYDWTAMSHDCYVPRSTHTHNSLKLFLFCGYSRSPRRPPQRLTTRFERRSTTKGNPTS
jgi:hypothetical protein